MLNYRMDSICVLFVFVFHLCAFFLYFICVLSFLYFICVLYVLAFLHCKFIHTKKEICKIRVDMCICKYWHVQFIIIWHLSARTRAHTRAHTRARTSSTINKAIFAVLSSRFVFQSTFGLDKCKILCSAIYSF